MIDVTYWVIWAAYNLVAAESFGLHLELLTHLSVFQWHQKLTPEHNPQLEATQLSLAPAL